MTKGKFIIAVSDIIDGELLVCEGNVFGRVVARFPRTYAGYRAAETFVRAAS